ncbi:MAG: YcxB family protein [Eubacteriales bacterium]|nr:YcxB family protein [Eubacteriales bacterium]
MVHCSASITYNEDTMKRMVKIRMRTFRGIGTYGLFAIGLVFLVLGVLSSYGTLATRTMMVAVGCFILVGINTPEKYMAKKIIQSMNGRFPKLSYDFGFEVVKIKGADNINRLDYEEIIRLVEDDEYLYVFRKDKSAFMIDRKTAKPKADSLKELLSEKTGLRWTKPRALAATSLITIIVDKKNTRKVQKK